MGDYPKRIIIFPIDFYFINTILFQIQFQTQPGKSDRSSYGGDFTDHTIYLLTKVSVKIYSPCFIPKMPLRGNTIYEKW
jgi:hypothetical protein